MRELPPGLLARLTQIDYDREMAFVLQDAKSGDFLGVSRISTDPDNIRAEFAVSVRSNLKGHGLGRLLMERLIAYAKARGTARNGGRCAGRKCAHAVAVPRTGLRDPAAAGESRRGAGVRATEREWEKTEAAKTRDEGGAGWMSQGFRRFGSLRGLRRPPMNIRPLPQRDIDLPQRQYR